MILIEIQEIMPAIITAVIVLLIVVIFFIPKELLASSYGNFTGKFLIMPRDTNIEVKETYQDAQGGVTGYRLEILTSLSYINPESLKEESVNVVPIVHFKGGSVSGTPFTITKNDMISGAGSVRQTLNLEVRTNEPPYKTEQNPFSGEVMEKQGLVMKSSEGGDFLVKLEKYDDTRVTPCELGFRIQCGNTTKALYLDEKNDCINDGGQYTCFENTEACDGVVRIEMNEKPDCDARKNAMTITVKEGTEGPVQEEISISFWRDGDEKCIAGETDYKRLTALCGKDRLSGLYLYSFPMFYM